MNIYQLELEVSRKVLAEIRPGVTLSHLDEVAHRAVDEAGYGQYFPHRVGHGLGIEGHEAPSVVVMSARAERLEKLQKAHSSNESSDFIW